MDNETRTALIGRTFDSFTDDAEIDALPVGTEFTSHDGSHVETTGRGLRWTDRGLLEFDDDPTYKFRAQHVTGRSKWTLTRIGPAPTVAAAADRLSWPVLVGRPDDIGYDWTAGDLAIENSDRTGKWSAWQAGTRGQLLGFYPTARAAADALHARLPDDAPATPQPPAPDARDPEIAELRSRLDRERAEIVRLRGAVTNADLRAADSVATAEARAEAAEAQLAVRTKDRDSIEAAWNTERAARIAAESKLQTIANLTTRYAAPERDVIGQVRAAARDLANVESAERAASEALDDIRESLGLPDDADDRAIVRKVEELMIDRRNAGARAEDLALVRRVLGTQAAGLRLAADTIDAVCGVDRG